MCPVPSVAVHVEMERLDAWNEPQGTASALVGLTNVASLTATTLSDKSRASHYKLLQFPLQNSLSCLKLRSRLEAGPMPSPPLVPQHPS
jgi:hypothetical protein